MRVFLVKLCQCLGLASLITVMNYGELLGGGADIRMHYPFPLTSICLAYIADIVLLALLFVAILLPLRRQRFYPVVRLFLAIVVPPYLISRVQSLFPFDASGLVTGLGLAWAAILLTLLLRFRRGFRATMRGASALAAFFGLFAISSIAQLLWIATWHPGPQQHAATWESTQQPPRQHAKVVWVIFDELSHDQVFEHRARDLQLPAFDQLRSQSLLYTDAQPIGLKTAKVVPSLITGHQVDQFRYSFTNRYRLHYTDSPGWHPITGADTIFADAQHAGFRTAAVGWYNPYCTLFASAIDDCYWQNLDRFDGPMAYGAPFWRNTVEPLRQLIREVKSPIRAERDNCTADVRERYKTDIDIESHALGVLKTDQADFIYLHFAIPHSPNVWSRIQGGYTQFCDNSYIDSLALADIELGKILTILKASPRWQNTTLVVQGDHSWRTEIWSETPTWTDEDDEASRTRGFDTRPAVLVHQPGQTTPQTDSSAWSVLNIHTVLEQSLHPPTP